MEIQLLVLKNKGEIKMEVKGNYDVGVTIVLNNLDINNLKKYGRLTVEVEDTELEVNVPPIIIDFYND
jgi:hypothetical protein